MGSSGSERRLRTDVAAAVVTWTSPATRSLRCSPLLAWRISTSRFCSVEIALLLRDVGSDEGQVGLRFEAGHEDDLVGGDISIVIAA